MKYRIFISFREGILDPESEAIKKTIKNVGFKDILKISRGKYFDIEFKNSKKEEINVIEDISREVLSNPIIENFKIKKIKN